MLTTFGIGVVLATADLGNALALGLWLALASVLALGGAAVARAVKRWTGRRDSVQTFTLQELREMRARREITEQEFAALRARVLSQGELPSATTAGPENAPDEFTPEEDGG